MSTLKASFAAAVLGLVVGVGCSAGADSPAVTSPGVVENSTTTAAPAPSSSTTTTAGFSAQAYCVEKLGALAVRYPKSLGGSDLASECSKMLRETDATSAKTIDALLEVSESYYKMVG
jgi:hypothetical protein